MRWDDLFADLEAQVEVMAARERALEVGELVRAERSRIALTDRIRPSLGAALVVTTGGGVRVEGELLQVSAEWLLIGEDQGRQTVVVARAVTSVSGLVRLSAPADSAGRVESRLGLASALRGLARDRYPVRVHLTDGRLLTGTFDRVGADFVELASHPADEVRRRTQVREVLALPFGGLAAIRRAG